MKKETIAKIMIILFFAVFSFFISVLVQNAISAEQPLTGITTIDHEAWTAVYNESHSFGVKTTATVPESDCVKCLKRYPLDGCWEIGTCLQVNKD